MGISVSLNTALSALLAQQAAVDTVSHNISNVATSGYSRQRVSMTAIPGSYSPGAPPVAGLGVEITDVRRVRDLFVDFQIRAGNHAAGRYAARAASLQLAEIALGEPGDSGLSAAMSHFWNSWRDLANAPDSAAARAAVVQTGETFAVTARRIYSSFVALRDDANARIKQDISEINALTKEIADLNQKIVSVAVSGNDAADLRDRRDLAVDRLSVLVDIRYQERDDGSLDISLDGRSLVRSVTSFAIYGDPDIANSNYVDLKFVADDSAVTVTDGELRGLLDQRDTDLPARIADLNALVAQIITDVNTAHAAGYGLDDVTGRNFFSGTDASDVAVDSVVLGDLNAVAAAMNGPPAAAGDGSNASAISDLQYARNLLGATATYDSFYEGFVSSLGAATREAERLESVQTLVLGHLEQARLSVSGVSLDEEMVNLMRFQRAYEAAARIISVVDEMLDTLINRMI